MSITSANSIVTLWQPILFPAPQQIQGFGQDDMYDMDLVQILQESMGVDGKLSFGFVYVPRPLNVTLQADSPMNGFFDTIAMQQQAAVDVYELGGQVVQPGVGLKYSLVNGGLKGYTPSAAAKKTLQPRRFQVIWESVTPSPTA